MSLTAEQWQRIEDAFHRCLEAPPEMWAEEMERALGDAPELQAVVQEMLDAHSDDQALTLEGRLPGDGPPATALTAGERLGKYEILGLLGKGGMGEVYSAHDSQLERDVALKILPPALASEPERVARFSREAKALAAIRHPGVVTVHSVEQEGEITFLTMELLDDATLSHALRDGGLSLDRFRSLATQLTDALAAAHAAGIVHRDLKPSNVLVSRDGDVTLIDFGLVRRQRQRSREWTDFATELGTQTGRVMGTWQYMSPEQARGEAVGPASDVFSLGIVFYEMLTGSRPFEKPSEAETVASILHENPPAIEGLRPELPAALVELVGRCLEKTPEDRFPDAAAVGEALAGLDSGIPARDVATSSVAAPEGLPGATPAPLHPSWLRATVIGLGLVVAVGGLALWQWQKSRVLEARESLGQIRELVAENRLGEAAALAEAAAAVLGETVELEELWPQMTSPFRVETTPPGADVYVRAYDESDDGWQKLGTTPLELDRLPSMRLRFRIEKDGYHTAYAARSLVSSDTIREIGNAEHDYLSDPSYVIERTMRPASEGSDMIEVAGGTYGAVPLLGFPPVFPLEIPTFFIDEVEVSASDYAEFVAAGGYEDASLWPEEMVEGPDGAESFEDAMTRLVDTTGRPGPASWALGAPSAGEDDLPVRGISWFEAHAYCRWRGAALPTIFHWARATLPSSDSWRPFHQELARVSQFGGAGPLAVDDGDGLAVSGARHLVGNVREWVSTENPLGRYAMGGAWSDPVYFVHDPHATPPWQREPTHGVRCAVYPEGEPAAHLARPMRLPDQTFREVDLADEVFQTYERAYAYDPSQPLNATLDFEEELPWGATLQWVSVDSAYGERLPIRLHLPAGWREAEALQPILHIGGGNVVRSPEMEPLGAPLDALVRSGRVLVEPVPDGAFQRNDGRTLQRLGGPERFEIITHWVQDLGRALDYLEQRAGIASGSVAFLGQSLGGNSAPALVPFLPRIRVLLLYSSGFSELERQERIDHAIGLLRRIEIPTLMLGGENDFTMPTELQRQMFRFLGTPSDKKRQVLFPGAGHAPLPPGETLRETVDFLELHLP